LLEIVPPGAPQSVSHLALSPEYDATNKPKLVHTDQLSDATDVIVLPDVAFHPSSNPCDFRFGDAPLEVGAVLFSERWFLVVEGWAAIPRLLVDIESGEVLPPNIQKNVTRTHVCSWCAGYMDGDELKIICEYPKASAPP